MWSTKDTKDAQILYLVGVAKNIADDSKKSSQISNTSNRETTKGNPAYIRDLPPWILEDPKGGVKKKDREEHWWCKAHRSGKVQWVRHNPEDHGKRTGTSPSGGGGTKPPGKGDINKKLTLSKDFKAGLLSIRYQNDVQDLLYQFNINAKRN